MGAGGWNRGLTAPEQEERRAATAARRYFCNCGALKAAGVLRCPACKAAKKLAPFVCACGGKKAREAAACRACYLTNVHADDSTCQWCQQTFRRGQKAPDRDARKYCSKTCYGAAKRIWAPGARGRFVASLRHELRSRLAVFDRRSQTAAPWRRCSCGAPIENPFGKCCRRCGAERKGIGIRSARAISRRVGCEHVCPNCGVRFHGHPGDVFCSAKCGRQLRGRNFSIRGLPLDERNKLAELIALVRAANRRLQGVADEGGAAGRREGGRDA
jgi:hypothetical protein